MSCTRLRICRVIGDRRSDALSGHRRMPRQSPPPREGQIYSSLLLPASPTSTTHPPGGYPGAFRERCSACASKRFNPLCWTVTRSDCWPPAKEGRTKPVQPPPGRIRRARTWAPGAAVGGCAVTDAALLWTYAGGPCAAPWRLPAGIRDRVPRGISSTADGPLWQCAGGRSPRPRASARGRGVAGGVEAIRRRGRRAILGLSCSATPPTTRSPMPLSGFDVLTGAVTNGHAALTTRRGRRSFDRVAMLASQRHARIVRSGRRVRSSSRCGLGLQASSRILTIRDIETTGGRGFVERVHWRRGGDRACQVCAPLSTDEPGFLAKSALMQSANGRSPRRLPSWWTRCGVSRCRRAPRRSQWRGSCATSLTRPS